MGLTDSSRRVLGDAGERAPRAIDRGLDHGAHPADRHDPLLVLDRVGKTYGKKARRVQAVSEVSLALAGGEVVLLLGRNGAGKSTLLRMIAGLIEPSAGEIRIDGRSHAGHSAGLRREIGWCSADERTFYPRLSGLENLRLFAALHGLDRTTADARIAQLEQRFGLGHVIERPFQACSTGERQKLNVIRALVHEPRLLLLDEPARSLDAAARATLSDVVSEFAKHEDRLVLLAGHDFEGLEHLAQRVVILDQGREVLSGSMEEIAGNVGQACWHVEFSSSAACARALEAYSGWQAGPSREIAVAPAPHGERSSDLVACIARFAADLERVERHAGPTLHELLALVGPAEHSEGQHAGRREGQHAGRSEGPHRGRSEPSRGELVEPRLEPPSVSSARSRERPRASPLGALLAMTRRDRLIFFTHRFQVGLRAGLLAAWVLSIYFVSKLVDRSSPQVAHVLSGDYFTYALLGMTFLRIMQVCLIQMASALREEQLQGTLEPLVATGQSSLVLLLGALSWPILSEAAGLALVFGTGAWLLGADVAHADAVAAAVAALATVFAMVEWGVLSASFVIAFKRGDPIALLVNLISIGLSGVYFPVELLPEWLRPLPRMLPLTWGLDAVRAAVVRGAGFASPEYVRALAGLAVLVSLLAPVAWWSQRRAFAYARRAGTLAQA
jgi:ABC-type multidrug transport system ATPase subunit/ABC-type multidrug transport system permease subunit